MCIDTMSTKSIDLLPKLESAFSEQKWDELLSLLNPKLFSTPESEELIAFPCLSKVAEILQAEEPVVPNNIKVVCLKCLGNSCFNGYKHKEYSSTNVEYGTYCLELYSKLITNNENLKKSEIYILYPFHSHFPYESVIEWTVNFIKSYKFNEDLMDDQLEILRLCIQFLCNLFTFACKNSSFDDQCSIPTFLYDTNLKSIIMNLTNFDHIPSVRASCIFIHNALREFEGQNFTNLEKTRLCSQLLKPIKKGFESAKEALMCLLYQSNLLRISYNDMNIEDKLYLLEIIHNEVSDSVYGCESDHLLRKDAINFLSERFCKRSDILLKTVDSYLDNMEPREIIILLDILGTVTSRSAKACQSIENYKSLLINCTYLLRSIQMIGKESNNYFTPMQKLSDIAKMMEETKNNGLQQNLSSTETEDNEYKDIRERKDLCSHPAFGFKAGLIRIIGNVSYRNKECQDLVREMDAIPLLLDCCNIDARNPLIMQWTILALRNLCEDNPENQEIVQNCTRTGVVENSVLREMGVTLHEDESGQKIGIVPLDLNKK